MSLCQSFDYFLVVSCSQSWIATARLLHPRLCWATSRTREAVLQAFGNALQKTRHYDSAVVCPYATFPAKTFRFVTCPDVNCFIATSTEFLLMCSFFPRYKTFFCCFLAKMIRRGIGVISRRWRNFLYFEPITAVDKVLQNCMSKSVGGHLFLMLAV